jgi:hypothetical protein
LFDVSRHLINLSSKERASDIDLQVLAFLQQSIGLLSTQGEWVDVAN